ncbi:hypothetical protein RhiLY_14080 [Ceratobasidium sp. AG-Ba]|nr:hypothetical protein RhiLY_14080 [Ceratobasidium sp. AG-Ba]
MSTPHARNIVRKLLADGQNLRIQEIYKRGLEQFPATPFPQPPPPKRFNGKGGVLKPAPPQPPHPQHPFRSKSYLKDVVLPDLIASNEVEKFHTMLDEAEESLTKKRITKSKQAIKTGGQDIWLWRLTGLQKEAGKNPKLEDEPQVTEPGWYQDNSIYPRPKIEKARSERDPYGAGPLDHLNKRRRNARPLKQELEKEWMKSIAIARAEGNRAEPS